jgi:hypothetical protein
MHLYELCPLQCLSIAWRLYLIYLQPLITSLFAEQRKGAYGGVHTQISNEQRMYNSQRSTVFRILSSSRIRSIAYRASFQEASYTFLYLFHMRFAHPSLMDARACGWRAYWGPLRGGNIPWRFCGICVPPVQCHHNKLLTPSGYGHGFIRPSIFFARSWRRVAMRGLRMRIYCQRVPR